MEETSLSTEKPLEMEGLDTVPCTTWIHGWHVQRVHTRLRKALDLWCESLASLLGLDDSFTHTMYSPSIGRWYVVTEEDDAGQCVHKRLQSSKNTPWEMFVHHWEA